MRFFGLMCFVVYDELLWCSLIYELIWMAEYKITVGLQPFSDQNAGLPIKHIIIWPFVPSNLLRFSIVLLPVYTQTSQSIIQMANQVSYWLVIMS